MCQGSRLHTCLGPETEAGSLAGSVHDCGGELAVASSKLKPGGGEIWLGVDAQVTREQHGEWGPVHSKLCVPTVGPPHVRIPRHGVDLSATPV